MEVIRIVNGNYKINTYLVLNGDKAILIDAGASVEQVNEHLQNGVEIMGILITHTHFDHIAELDNLYNKFQCPVYVEKNGINSLYEPEENLSVMDKPISISRSVKVVAIKDDDSFDLAGLNIKVITTKGHAESSVFYIVNNDVAFTGDTLFAVCIGRTDIKTANVNHYIETIEKLRKLPMYEIYYPGHGKFFNYEKAKMVLDNALDWLE